MQADTRGCFTGFKNKQQGGESGRDREKEKLTQRNSERERERERERKRSRGRIKREGIDKGGAEEKRK